MKPNLPTGNLVKNKSFKNISKDSAFWFFKKTFSTPKQNQRELGKDRKRPEKTEKDRKSADSAIFASTDPQQKEI